MIAIVYTGSRFADWRLVEKGRVLSAFRTNGINPYIQDERFIFQTLNKDTQLINNAERIRRIYFFGAGASSPERQEKVARVFRDFFKFAKVKVSHDMLASAIATFGNESGIIAIIGSGSNAAHYNGKKIADNNYGLGYILADEGSTNWLARRLLKDFLTESMPQGFREKLLHEHPIDRKIILERVYNSPNPNIFLNSFSDLIFENKEDAYIEGVIKSGLELFFDTYLVPLSEMYPDAPINFTGSVANHCSAWLYEIAGEHHLTINKILREPVQSLVKYYINKN